MWNIIKQYLQLLCCSERKPDTGRRCPLAAEVRPRGGGAAPSLEEANSGSGEQWLGVERQQWLRRRRRRKIPHAEAAYRQRCVRRELPEAKAGHWLVKQQRRHGGATAIPSVLRRGRRRLLMVCGEEVHQPVVGAGAGDGRHHRRRRRCCRPLFFFFFVTSCRPSKA